MRMKQREMEGGVSSDSVNGLVLWVLVEINGRDRKTLRYWVGGISLQHEGGRRRLLERDKGQLC